MSKVGSTFRKASEGKKIGNRSNQSKSMKQQDL